MSGTVKDPRTRAEFDLTNSYNCITAHHQRLFTALYDSYDDINNSQSQFCDSTNLYASRQKQQPISIPELVKKLNVPPARRTDVDCKLMADALFNFVSSMEAWKDGLLTSSNHTNTALSRISNFRLPYAQVLSKQMHSQWPDRLNCRLWTRTKQYFRKVLDHLVFLSIQLCSFTILILFCARTITLGEVGNEFYFVLQGSVAVKVNSKVVKVRCALRLLAPLTALVIAPDPPMLMATYPILHHSSGPWRQDFIRRACDAVQMQTLCLGWCGRHSNK